MAKDYYPLKSFITLLKEIKTTLNLYGKKAAIEKIDIWLRKHGGSHDKKTSGEYNRLD